MHLLTEHFFMTKHAYLISRLFFFILMWLTHHFLSISTFNASVVKMLISYFRGKSTGTARKTGLRAVPESRASLPGDPSAGKAGLRISHEAASTYQGLPVTPGLRLAAQNAVVRGTAF